MSQSGIGFNAAGQRGYYFQSRMRISEFIIDETLIKVYSGNYVCLWIAAIESKEKMILDIHISIERSILVAEQFIQSLIRKYGKHNIFN